MRRPSIDGGCAVVAVVQSLATSCSQEWEDSKDHCDCYAIREVCVDDVCARACDTTSDCPESGQHCVHDYYYDAYCGCDPDRCDDREDCSSTVGSCVAVECSERVSCESASAYCDVERRRCYPDNGDCSAQDCPPVPAALTEFAAVDCAKDDICEARRVSILPPFGSPRYSEPIQVDEPQPGERAEDANEVEFAWQEFAESALVLVFDAEPSETEEFRERAVWGAAIPAGEHPRVAWQAGYPVVDGEWLLGTPSPLSPGVYYLLVQAVEAVDVMRLSPLVPFLIGEDTEPPWPRPNDSCDDEGLTEQCEHPQLPMVCDGANCRQLCGSAEDCLGGRACERPDERLGARMCSK